jgi:hypothetical protein
LTALTDPKGNLATPCAVNPDGELRPLLVDANGKLITDFVPDDYVHPNHSGDVTSVGDGAQTIGANKVTLAMLATQAAETVLANATAGAAVPTALAVAAQTVLGRITGGHIVGLTPAQLKTLCGYLTDLVGDTTPDLGGPLVVGDQHILLSSAPTASKWSGIAASFKAHEAFTIGQIGFMNADSEIALGDADAIASAGCIAMATASISANATGVFLLYGFMHLHGLVTWTVGAKLYLSETAGIPTSTLVTGSAGVSQIVGIATAADTILFYGNLAMAVIT